MSRERESQEFKFCGKKFCFLFLSKEKCCVRTIEIYVFLFCITKWRFKYRTSSAHQQLISLGLEEVRSALVGATLVRDGETEVRRTLAYDCRQRFEASSVTPSGKFAVAWLIVPFMATPDGESGGVSRSGCVDCD